MKKVLSIGLAVLMTMSLAACGSASPVTSTSAAPSETQSTEAQQTVVESTATTAEKPDVVYEWNMASIMANPATTKEFNVPGQVQQLFVDFVNERSGGRIVITPYYDSLMGGSLELFEQVQRGELEIALLQPMSSYDSRFAVPSIPFLFDSIDEVQALAGEPDGPLFKMFEEWMAEKGITYLGAGCAQFHGVFNTKHEVTTVDSVRDLKLRTYQDTVVNMFWEKICNAVPLAFSDVYTSLQTKAVDGLAMGAQNTYVYKFSELGGYYSDVDWQWCSGCNIIMNQAVFESVPEDLQELIKECAYDACSQYAVLEKEGNQAVLKRMEDEHGIQVHYLTEEERQTWKDYAATLEPEIRAFIGEEIYDEVIAAVEEYRKNQ